MKGYKSLNKNLSSIFFPNFKWKIGEWVVCKKPLKITNNMDGNMGLFASKTIKGALSWAIIVKFQYWKNRNKRKTIRVFEVETRGIIKTDKYDTEFCASEMRLVKEIHFPKGNYNLKYWIDVSNIYEH